MLSKTQIRRFRSKVYAHYEKHGRALPWRKTRNPYRILVSEVMLQQTQVSRVVSKYREFIRAFPDFHTLARAPERKLVRVWQGLGYNRRAFLLKKLAQHVVNDYGGKTPRHPDELKRLPGIGPYTANAICAFAFGKPVVFVETNIRSVFIHHFFADRDGVSDGEIVPLVEATLDRDDPRSWYNALMDYGVYLKQTVGNPGRKSRSYKRQSPFKGSNRQVRGAILRLLSEEASLTEAALVKKSGFKASRVKAALSELCEEGLVKKKGRRIEL
jgi:A/G-specific adenine glycosylase